jgi:ABC-type glycerol-3-phosphate transport system permease component
MRDNGKHIRIRGMAEETRFRSLVSIVALTVLAVFTFYPFLMMVIFAFKNNSQFFQQRWVVSLPLHTGNFLKSWKVIAPTILNSLILSSVNAVGASVLASLAAYSFARFRFPGKSLFYYLLISAIMVPNILYVIPLFQLVNKLHIYNTYFGVWGPLMASGQVMMIMILRSFYEELPLELFESARIDGLGEVGMLLRIALPLSFPIVLTVGLLNMQSVWNEFVWPLMVIRDKVNQPLSVGIYYFSGTVGVGASLIRFGEMFAGYAIGALPLCILFAFTSRYFIRGLTSGAIKG